MDERIIVDETVHGRLYTERNIITAVSQWYANNPDAEDLPPVLFPSETGYVEIPAIDVFDCFAAYHRFPPLPVIDASRDDRDRRRSLYGSNYR